MTKHETRPSQSSLAQGAEMIDGPDWGRGAQPDQDPNRVFTQARGPWPRALLSLGSGTGGRWLGDFQGEAGHTQPRTQPTSQDTGQEWAVVLAEHTSRTHTSAMPP